VLAALPRPEGAAGTALDLLRRWDGTAAMELPQPLIFNAWWRRFGRLALAAGGVPEGGWEPGPEFVRFVLAGDGRGAHWCGAGGCAPLAARALEQSVAELAARFGPDPSAWRWGEAHVARFDHPVLRFVPGLGDLVRLEIPTPGDGETVNRGTTRSGGAQPFAHVQGAAFRGVFDLGGRDAALLTIAGGQSGHPLSPHWGDMMLRWRDGVTVTPGTAGGDPAIRLLP
jgi:penicillin amidase